MWQHHWGHLYTQCLTFPEECWSYNPRKVLWLLWVVALADCDKEKSSDQLQSAAVVAHHVNTHTTLNSSANTLNQINLAAVSSLSANLTGQLPSSLSLSKLNDTSRSWTWLDGRWSFPTIIIVLPQTPGTFKTNVLMLSGISRRLQRRTSWISEQRVVILGLEA